MLRNGLRSLFAVLAVTAVFAMAAGDADARARFSAGSRGTRTFQAPAATATAPKAAAPIERSTMNPGAASAARPAAAQPARPGLLSGGLFGGGLLGGLAAGFIGAGLFGMLFGHGLMGGMGGFASILGLLLQIGLVVIVARLAWTWWQRRNQPALAGGPSLHENLSSAARPNAGGFAGFSGFGGGAPVSEAPLQVKPEDFDAYERLLNDVMVAYGAEDMTALRSRVTPEMLSYFSEELARNSSNGDINQISDVKLLQGDLSEAWREGNDEYATVAMRFSLKDRMVERASGRLIEELPSEATELWTFRRAPGGNWVVSAIQQTE